MRTRGAASRRSRSSSRTERLRGARSARTRREDACRSPTTARRRRASPFASSPPPARARPRRRCGPAARPGRPGRPPPHRSCAIQRRAARRARGPAARSVHAHRRRASATRPTRRAARPSSMTSMLRSEHNRRSATGRRSASSARSTSAPPSSPLHAAIVTSVCSSVRWSRVELAGPIDLREKRGVRRARSRTAPRPTARSTLSSTSRHASMPTGSIALDLPELLVGLVPAAEHAQRLDRVQAEERAERPIEPVARAISAPSSEIASASSSRRERLERTALVDRGAGHVDPRLGLERERARPVELGESLVGATHAARASPRASCARDPRSRGRRRPARRRSPVRSTAIASVAAVRPSINCWPRVASTLARAALGSSGTRRTASWQCSRISGHGCRAIQR